MACGIPLVCSPWRDAEHLFTPGKDFLLARDGEQMTLHLRSLIATETRRARLVAHGLTTIRARHTCAHRVDQLMAIHAEIMKERHAVVVPATRLFRRKPNTAAAAAAS